MKLPDTTNTLITCIGILIGSGGAAVGLKANSEAGENRDNLLEWTKRIQAQVNAHDVALAELRGYKAGYAEGLKAGAHAP